MTYTIDQNMLEKESQLGYMWEGIKERIEADPITFWREQKEFRARMINDDLPTLFTLLFSGSWIGVAGGLMPDVGTKIAVGAGGAIVSELGIGYALASDLRSNIHAYRVSKKELRKLGKELKQKGYNRKERKMILSGRSQPNKALLANLVSD
jgi:hypothetical protein